MYEGLPPRGLASRSSNLSDGSFELTYLALCLFSFVGDKSALIISSRNTHFLARLTPTLWPAKTVLNLTLRCL